MDSQRAGELFAGVRIARLGTVGMDGRPHLVPIVLALLRVTIDSAVDAKRTRTTALTRLSLPRQEVRYCFLPASESILSGDRLR